MMANQGRKEKVLEGTVKRTWEVEVSLPKEKSCLLLKDGNKGGQEDVFRT